MQRKYLYFGISALIVLVAVPSSLLLVINLNMPPPNSSFSETQAVEVAQQFLLNSTTFRFDGMKDSIMIGEAAQFQSGWVVRINFSCSHSGYGNRTGVYVLNVVSPHQIRVTIQEREVSSAVIDDVWDEIAQSYLYTKEKAIETAKEFLLNCPTFKFDGISESVRVIGAYTLRSPWTWMVQLNFTCAHSGYGNRTGLVLLQVLTDHEISIVVQKGVVIRAIIDDVWDEANQKLLPSLDVTTDKMVCREGENITVTIRNTLTQTVRFGSTAYGIAFEKWDKDKWVFHSSIYGAEVVVSLEPEQTKQITVTLSNIDQPFTSGRYRVVSSGWTERDGQYTPVWGYAEFTIE